MRNIRNARIMLVGTAVGASMNIHNVCWSAMSSSVSFPEYATYVTSVMVGTREGGPGPFAGAVGNTRVHTIRMQVEDGAAGANTRVAVIAPINPGAGQNTVNGCKVQPIGGGKYDVSYNLVRATSNPISGMAGGCGLQITVTNQSTPPQMRIRSMSRMKPNGQPAESGPNAAGIIKAFIGEPAAWNNTKIAVSEGGPTNNPLPWSAWATPSNYAKTITQHSASLSVKYEPNILLNAKTPTKWMMDVTGTGKVESVWRCTGTGPQLRILTGTNDIWNKDTLRTIKAGDSFDIEVAAPQTMGWGEWKKGITVEWSPQ